MADLVDMTGQRFGKLTVLRKGKGRYTTGGAHKTTWICKCDCGNETEVDAEKLRKGHTTSCGCVRKENKGSRFEDLTGQKFGRLTVIRFIPAHERTSKQYHWLCRCDCGNYTDANASKLKMGLQKSCGCLKAERNKAFGDINKKYKNTNKRLYGVYKSMLARCYDENHREYHNYGGRGITVCPEWLGEFGYDAFAEWALSNGYDDNAVRGECTIDRKDVNAGYTPDNCTWISNAEQQNNKRTNHLLTYRGETHNMKQWSEILGISYYNMTYHIYKGRTLEEIIDMNR